jgi:glucose-6-phosphate 1-dehydrogenase
MPMNVSNRPKASVQIRDAAAPPGPEPIRAHDPVPVVIFGASGDLSRRKLIPAIYHLHEGGYLPDRYAVVGFSRTPMSDDEFRKNMHGALQESLEGEGAAPPADHPVVQSLYYHPGNNDDLESFKSLHEKLGRIEKERDIPHNRLYYLSISPQFFPVVLNNLKASGLLDVEGWSRVIIEKPFGRDLQSARELNRVTTSVLNEDQIYRIDHYLGKETVQNILSFRFANSIFEPLFNQKYVDHVEITVSETLGMEGRRGAYFDTAGTLRDMVENHVLQLLCLIAMEPPSAWEAQAVRDEKVKVLRALLPMSRKEVAQNTVRGQYGVGERDGEIVKGYRQEEGVGPESVTESYVALRVNIDNWRWAGVPFFLRSGKRLRKRVSEIAVSFKQPPLHLFRDLAKADDLAPVNLSSNVLVMRIQPNEGISLSFACKRPGMRIQLADVDMDFFYGEAFQQRSPEAYERLLLDAMRGDASLFTRSDEVEHAWRFITSILEGWATLPPPTFPNYYPFTDGPDEAQRLFDGLQGRWRPVVEY